MNEYAESLLKLPGTEEEKEWLELRLEMLSVKEGIVLAAAVERSPPNTMMDAVNHLLTLEQYDVVPAGSYEQLGAFYLWNQCVPQEQRAFFDQSALGQWYEDEHPGLFVGNCYVAYPERDGPAPYDGQRLPTDDERLDWSVRLKLASQQVPEGVWVKFPDYDEFEDGRAGDFRLALDALKVNTLTECTLLDARCILPCVQDLAGQYDDLADLIDDGQNLGCLLDERGQGIPDFLGRFAAALEVERCSRLDEAVRIAEDLLSYEIVSVDAFTDKVAEELNRRALAEVDGAIRICFDYTAYSTAVAKREGYEMTDDGCVFIRKRDSPTLEQQSDRTGMTMQ